MARRFPIRWRTSGRSISRSRPGSTELFRPNPQSVEATRRWITMTALGPAPAGQIPLRRFVCVPARQFVYRKCSSRRSSSGLDLAGRNPSSSPDAQAFCRDFFHVLQGRRKQPFSPSELPDASPGFVHRSASPTRSPAYTWRLQLLGDRRLTATPSGTASSTHALKIRRSAATRSRLNRAPEPFRRVLNSSMLLSQTC